MENQEIIAEINKWLPEMPAHTNFIPAIQPIPNVFIPEKHQDTLVKNELLRAAQRYLIVNGFAQERNLVGNNIREMELTATGRKLKEIGSVEKYQEWLHQEQDMENNRKLLADQVARMNLNSEKIQKRLLTTNIWIAIVGGVAGLYYIVALIQLLCNWAKCP